MFWSISGVFGPGQGVVPSLESVVAPVQVWVSPWSPFIQSLESVHAFGQVSVGH